MKLQWHRTRTSKTYGMQPTHLAGADGTRLYMTHTNRGMSRSTGAPEHQRSRTTTHRIRRQGGAGAIRTARHNRSRVCLRKPYHTRRHAARRRNRRHATYHRNRVHQRNNSNTRRWRTGLDSQREREQELPPYVPQCDHRDINKTGRAICEDWMTEQRKTRRYPNPTGGGESRNPQEPPRGRTKGNNLTMCITCDRERITVEGIDPGYGQNGVRRDIPLARVTTLRWGTLPSSR